MDVGSSVVADEQPLEVVQPGDGALDDPAARPSPEPCGPAAGDHGFDAAADEPAVLVVVVAAVGDEHVGSQRGLPIMPRTGGTLSISGISWVTSLRLPPVSVQASGIPLASTRRWCLEPASSVNRARARRGAPFSPAHGWSRRPPATTRAPRGPQLREQQHVQPLPHTRPLPLVQPPLAGRARAEAELERQVPPGDPGVKTNRIPCSASRSGSRLRPETQPPLDRQQRLDPLPQRIRHDPRRNRHRHPLLSLTTDADGFVATWVPSFRFEFLADDWRRRPRWRPCRRHARSSLFSSRRPPRPAAPCTQLRARSPSKPPSACAARRRVRLPCSTSGRAFATCRWRSCASDRVGHTSRSADGASHGSRQARGGPYASMSAAGRAACTPHRCAAHVTGGRCSSSAHGGSARIVSRSCFARTPGRRTTGATSTETAPGDTWYESPAIDRVDLRRPFLDGGVPPRFRAYDRGFLHWLARRHHAVDYLADDDFERIRDGDRLARLYDLVMFPGHEEYVTAHAHDVLDRFRDFGGNLAFLSANNVFYRVERRGKWLIRTRRWRDLGRPAGGTRRRPARRLEREPVPERAVRRDREAARAAGSSPELASGTATASARSGSRSTRTPRRRRAGRASSRGSPTRSGRDGLPR